MAELLYRLGKWSARRAWVILAAWAAILAIAGVGFALGFKGIVSSFEIPGTASSVVIEELERELPDFSGASGTVVFHTTDGSVFTDAQRERIGGLIDDADGLPDVASVVNPFETEQQRADRVEELEQARAQLDAGRAQLDAAQQQLDAARAQLTDAQALAALDAQQTELDSSRAELEAQAEQLANGTELLNLSSGIRLVSEDGTTALVSVAFTEPRTALSEGSKEAVMEHFRAEPIVGVEVEFSSDISQGVPEVLGVGEIVGVAIAAIVLLVMLGTVIAAALPLVTAVVGVGVGVLTALSFSGVVQMASVTPVLGVMLGLAVGIDYALFIVNRHRRQLRQGAEVVESIALANGTAGNAVLFAGSTVIVALLALNVTGIPFLGVMGSVGALCVAIAVLIAVTLTPALLRLAGLRVLNRRARAEIGHPRHQASKAKPMGTVRAIATILVGAAALLALASPAMSMRLGLPDGSSEPRDSSAYRAYTLTETAFGEGVNGTLLVTAELPDELDDAELIETQAEIAGTIADLNDVVAVAPIAVSDDGRLAAFQVVPEHGPNSESTEQLVRDLRQLPPIDGIPIGVAGQAAINIDISENLAGVLPLYLAVVVGLSLVIMIVVFRSLLVPIIATGGFILSLFATFGALVAVFQWGWLGDLFGVANPGPILSFLPVILVGILFGLAMDYQLFLTSGMREAFVHGSTARVAVAEGFRAGRSVVIAAGMIMVAVFGGFVFSDSVMIRSLGFGLAFGILVDAFVVRMLLVPAIMHLLGRAAWWLPRWLDRILPNVDVEGAALERRHHF